MIECGYCGAATPAGRCTSCGRESALPWTQRNLEPPTITERTAGRPPLDPSQITQRLRLAYKENPGGTNAEIADYLNISPSTLVRWQKMASLRTVTAGLQG